MQIKRILGILSLGLTLQLNAGLFDMIYGENISKEDYKTQERGIIVNKDIDADGILDIEDDCLETVPCHEEGCKKEELVATIEDNDNDGVLDNIDECLNTPKGFEVDEVGCSKLVNLEVQFDLGKATLKEDFLSQLDTFSDFMEKHENYTAQIQGHTDNIGTQANNQTLSLNRAENVMNYLIEKGIDKNRLDAQGFGELNPIDNNDTKDGRANNRRVIATLNK